MNEHRKIWKDIRPALMVALALAVVQIATGWITYKQSINSARETKFSSAADLAVGLVNAISDAVVFKDYGAIESRMRQAMSNNEAVEIWLVNPEGKVLSGLQRESNEIKIVFKPLPVGLPATTLDKVLIQTSDQIHITTWSKINVGTGLGWIKLTTLVTLGKDELNGLRRQTLWLLTASLLSGALALGFFLWRTYFSLVKRERTVGKKFDDVSAMHKKLDESHRLVMDSVNYASRLQRGQLPRQKRIDGCFASFATLWEPRDTIGGDLWWVSSSQRSGPFILAVADCTGHGVPGAMLSLLVSNSLERIYAHSTDEDPATALVSLDHFVRTGLNQDRAESESDDGCDALVLRIDREKQAIELAGAKIGLFQMTVQGQVIRHSVARCSLGYIEAIAEADKPKVATISYSTGDLFVIVTDGFTDQIGGPGGKKIAYGYRRLESLLQKNKDADAQTMAECMREDFKRWQGAEVRRDDVTAVVFRL